MAGDVMHHQLGDRAICGAALEPAYDELTWTWVRVECLACVAGWHPVMATRQRAIDKLGGPPAARDQATVEAWLSAP